MLKITLLHFIIKLINILLTIVLELIYFFKYLKYTIIKYNKIT